MKRLDKKDIDYIRYDLKNRGVLHGSLHEEMVDHVCCEVEILIKEGAHFKKAYEKVVSQLQPNQLVVVQDKTIRSENYNNVMLLKNNLKIMLRNMLKNRSYTVINIGGLVLGLLCFIVVALYVSHELSFDTFFSKSESIYRITMSTVVGGKANHIPTAYPALGPAISDRYADVTEYARVINYKYSRLVPTFKYEDRVFYEDRVIFADSTFFRIFDFPFVEGDPATALLQPASVVLTKSMAKKYFGNESALGKYLNFNTKNDLQVTGVINDIPSNTHMQFDFIIPMSGLQFSGIFPPVYRTSEDWSTDWFWTYMVIRDPQAVSKIAEEGLDKLTDEKIPDTKQEYQAKFFLQPLGDIHLKSDFDYNTDITENGSQLNLYILASVGIIVLFISGINFINITIALATRRYKEIGISKVLGAFKAQLRFQFIGESIFICLIALLLAFIVLIFLLPVFSQILGTELHLNLYRDFVLMISILAFTIVIGLLSGLYPAVFMSSFEPHRVLKGVWNPGKGGSQFRKFLVGVQISISISLVIGTIVIFQQLKFIHDKKLGFDKEQVVMLTVRGTSIPQKYYTMKHRLERNASIVSVSSVSEPIGREVQFMSFKVEGQENDQFIKILNVTHDFVKTMGLEIVKGRDFSREFGTDSTAGFLINEAAARAYGWTDPVGKAIKHAFPRARQGTIIGVVKDFNFEPLHKQIDPLVIFYGGAYWYVVVKVKSGDLQNTLAFLENTWNEFEPDKPFAFQFLDQSIQKVYDKEQRVSKVFLIFSVFSIITASLGLFGLVSFVAKQRLTEIGIRKVLGASINNILTLVAKDYVMLVFVAFVLATPATYFIMNLWLEKFAFRISWNVFYFLIGLLLILCIVTCTVLIKTLGAAKSNPVKILRNE